jgi:hypothetical protein
MRAHNALPKGIKGKRHQECSYVGALGQKSMGGIKKADTQKIKAVSKKGINTHATAV